MNLATLRSDVSACRAWERLLHAGSKETRTAAALPGRWETWVPLLMALYGFASWGTGHKPGGMPWSVFVPWYWLFAGSRLFPRTVPTEWEALRLPSRRGWLLARWSLRAPHLFLLGACTLVHNLFLAMGEYPHHAGIRWPVAATVVLAPFFVAALVSWFHIQSHSVEGRSPTAPVIALGLVTLLCAGATVYFWTRRSDTEFPIEGFLSAVLAATTFVILLLTLPPLVSHWRSGRPLWPSTGIGPFLFHGATGVAGILAGFVVLLTVVFNPVSLNAPREPDNAWLNFVPPAVVLVGMAVVVANALHLVGRIDLAAQLQPVAKVAPPKSPEVFQRAGEIPVPSGFAKWPAGGGLRAASWALYRGSWRTLRHPWLYFVPKLFWECRGPFLGMGAIVALAFGSTLNLVQSFMALWIPAFVLLYIPRPFRLAASRRLHLLGADFAAVARHNLKWGLITEVLPAALGGAVLFLIPFEDSGPTLAARAGAWLGVVGILILRQGAGATSLLDHMDWLGCRGSLAVFAVFGLGWYFAAPLTLAVGGAIVFALAVHSTIRDVRDPVAAGKRVEEAAADD